jgi:hypothetical protein
MKKLLLISLALLIGSVLTAQESKNTVNKHSFLALHAGPSFPVGAFGSNNPGNENAGLAKTGYTIAMNYGYRFNSPLGVEVSAFYNHYGTQKMVLNVDVGDGTETIDMTLDDWYLYGISLGPSLEFNPAKTMRAGFHVMGGVANVRLPAFYFDGEDATKADWGIGPVIQAGMNLKFDAGKQVFFFINGDYQYMRPVFNILDLWTDESEKGYQKISVLQATAGIGIRF